MRAPTTMRNQMDLADYKRYIRNHIIQMQEKTIMDTKEKIIGIFSIMIQVFRLPHAGAVGGGRTIPLLKKHIMRREIRYIDTEKNNQNLCFFLAYSFITMPDIKAVVAAYGSAITAKRYKEHSRIAEAKRLFQRIYGKKFMIIIMDLISQQKRINLFRMKIQILMCSLMKRQRQPQRQPIQALQVSFGAWSRG
ncbi:MAG: hypothetical protein EZS28_050882 [Streblomastix strix]|uniref:Uncharacterized protein n=1 Tax=Streblomastix strix TaxID=222440 RepID=A0A5J4T7A3_9EUKA|nr:MAG: hypothetical protein EZS28_050882 [Streblomastix strix]